MPDLAMLVVIFLAVAIGFGAGRYIQNKGGGSGSAVPWSKKRYLQGLRYLLDEQTDESLDVFINSMEVSPQTLELHLSLGGLLRRKGEFERALKVHENLLNHASLDKPNHHLVQYELAKDYFSSGLLDRAELLLNELIANTGLSNELRRNALTKLVAVHQDTKEWLTAIDIADRLTENKFADQADKWRQQKAQFACELAELAQSKGDAQEARKWARAALSYDNACVRASLLQAQQDIEEAKYPAAIARLKMIPLQSPDHASQMLSPLLRCYEALGDEANLIEELTAYLTICADITALSDLFTRERRLSGDRRALEVLQQNADKFPAHQKVFKLAEHMQLMDDLSDESLAKLTQVVGEMIDTTRTYFCRSCGFTADKLHWLCPGCQRWSSMVLQ